MTTYGLQTPRRTARFASAALMVAAICGCRSEPPDRSGGGAPDEGGSPPATMPGDVGRVVFESSYVNFAWVHQHVGTFIDRDGVIWRYDHSEAPWQAEMTEDGRVPAAALDERHAGAERLGAVEPAELARMAQRIEEAATGELRRRQAGADMGASTLTAWRYDAASDSYREVVLRSRGDWDVDNTSPAAAVLADWLEGVLPDG